MKPGDIVIDATCGGGHDSLQLAGLDPGHLYAFDVQPEAIAKTRALLTEAGMLPSEHISCELLPHEEMPEYFRALGMLPQIEPSSEDSTPAGENIGSSAGFAAAVVFNLGYLPGGDKKLTTRTETTLAAVRGAMQLLKKDGLLCITMYSGHAEGAREKKALLAFAEGLDSHIWHVSYINMLNQKKSPPEILLISRKR